MKLIALLIAVVLILWGVSGIHAPVNPSELVDIVYHLGAAVLGLLIGVAAVSSK